MGIVYVEKCEVPTRKELVGKQPTRQEIWGCDVWNLKSGLAGLHKVAGNRRADEQDELNDGWSAVAGCSGMRCPDCKGEPRRETGRGGRSSSLSREGSTSTLEESDRRGDQRAKRDRRMGPGIIRTTNFREWRRTEAGENVPQLQTLPVEIQEDRPRLDQPLSVSGANSALLVAGGPEVCTTVRTLRSWEGLESAQSLII
jgi:hypothetical protein